MPSETDLAPYAMRESASRGRAHREAEHAYRGRFHRDRDRIVHSSAFRRLEYKTQVFVNHEGDHYRTRLTHSVEVAQVARSLARALRLNEDLAESLALVHDIGHPPFGHSGEAALDAELAAHGGFNHNRHALRVVDQLESRYPDFPGLNLSYEIREAIVKHGAPAGPPYLADFHADEAVTLEAQVADLADSIAYDSHDVEDVLNAGLLEEADFKGLLLWERAQAAIGRDLSGHEPGVRRYQLKRTVIDLLVSDAIAETRRRIETRGIRSLADVRAAREAVVGSSAAVAPEKKEFERFMRARAYGHHRIVRMARKGGRFVRDLFRAFVEEPRQMPEKWRRRADVDGLHAAVRDYVAGMTDRFAQDEWLKLFQPFERV